MAGSIASVTLVVRDHDEAITFFTDALPMDGGKRWVVVFLDLYGNKWDLVQPGAG